MDANRALPEFVYHKFEHAEYSCYPTYSIQSSYRIWEQHCNHCDLKPSFGSDCVWIPAYPRIIVKFFDFSHKSEDNSSELNIFGYLLLNQIYYGLNK